MARAPTPTPAKNTVRVVPNNPSVSRVFKAGDNPSRADTSRAETPSLQAESNAHRGEYHAEEAKTRAQLSAELARQAREEGASAHGGVGDYLSSD
ncbi:MAG: hypothetical protein WA733_10600 [Methylocystis sp.]